MNPRLKRRLIAVWVTLFLAAWLTGMTAGLTAAACRKDRYEGVAKLRYCSISLTAGAWMRLDTRERARGAVLHQERGIALTQLGRDAEARQAFARAMADAAAFDGPYRAQLNARMAPLSGTPTAQLWDAVATVSGG